MKGAEKVSAKPPSSPFLTQVVETLQVTLQRARFCKNEGYTTLPCSLGTHLVPPSVRLNIFPHLLEKSLVSRCPCGFCQSEEKLKLKKD